MPPPRFAGGLPPKDRTQNEKLNVKIVLILYILMLITTIEGFVKNGKIELTEDIKLLENAVVYVVIPSLERDTVKNVNQRLAGKEEANDVEIITKKDL